MASDNDDYLYAWDAAGNYITNKKEKKITQKETTPPPPPPEYPLFDDNAFGPYDNVFGKNIYSPLYYESKCSFLYIHAHGVYIAKPPVYTTAIINKFAVAGAGQCNNVTPSVAKDISEELQLCLDRGIMPDVPVIMKMHDPDKISKAVLNVSIGLGLQKKGNPYKEATYTNEFKGNITTVSHEYFDKLYTFDTDTYGIIDCYTGLNLRDNDELKQHYFSRTDLHDNDDELKQSGGYILLSEIIDYLVKGKKKYISIVDESCSVFNDRDSMTQPEIDSMAEKYTDSRNIARGISKTKKKKYQKYQHQHQKKKQNKDDTTDDAHKNAPIAKGISKRKTKTNNKKRKSNMASLITSRKDPVIISN